MNPCLDRYFYIDKLKEDDTIRVNNIIDYPAGKGIDISRAINEMKGHSVAITLLGGDTGRQIMEMLDEEGVLTKTPEQILSFKQVNRSIDSVFLDPPLTKSKKTRF